MVMIALANAACCFAYNYDAEPFLWQLRSFFVALHNDRWFTTLLRPPQLGIPKTLTTRSRSRRRSVCLSVCLSVYLSVRLPACQFVNLSCQSVSQPPSQPMHQSVNEWISLLVCRSGNVSVRESVCQYVCLSANMSVYLCVCLSVCQSVSVSVRLPVCLSACQSVSVSISQSVSQPASQPVHLHTQCILRTNTI